MLDSSCSAPTYTHMAIKELERTGIVKHVVSQNCDGLHFRSGLTMNSLSEIHGNMFVEFCSLCKHNYIRDFDVTERTSFRRHRTGRRCNNCFTNLASSKSDNKNYPKSSQSDRNNNNSISNIDSNDKKNINSKTDTEDDDSDTDNNADQRPALYDSIVHFGEKSHFGFPYNWEAAVRAVDQCDLIVCLGSSLKVLRHYKCLWPGRNRKVSLVIVNLQWTSKDKMAQLKINAKCDLVMRLLSELFEIKVPSYSIDLDPLQQLYRPLDKDEEHTCNRHHIFQQPPLNTTFSNIKCERIRNEAHTVIPDQEVPSTSIPSGWFGKGIKRKK